MVLRGSCLMVGVVALALASGCPAADDAVDTGADLIGDGDGDGETGGEGDGDGDTAGDGDGDTVGDGDGDGDESCHPLEAMACPIVGHTCTWNEEAFVCLPGITKLGDSCDPMMPQCLSGFCAPAAMLPDCPSTYCCTAFCNLDSPFCPENAGSTCTDYFPEGATTPEVGACLN